MRPTRFLLISLYCLFVQQSATKRKYDIKMTSYTCNVLKPKSVNFIECIVYNHGKYPVMKTTFNLAREFDHFDIHFLLDIWRKDNTISNLVNIKFDGCQYFSAASLTNFMSVAQKRIMKISNLPKKCPIKANKTYSVNNYTVYPDDFPVNVPSAIWRLTIKLSYMQQLYANITLRGAVVHHS